VVFRLIHKPSLLVRFGLPSALSRLFCTRDIVLQTIGNKPTGERAGQLEGADPTGSAMAAKMQKAKNKKPAPKMRRSPVLPAVIGTLFNMVATIATFGSVLLCLVVAKHFA
jgi:hypothetical protein